MNPRRQLAAGLVVALTVAGCSPRSSPGRPPSGGLAGSWVITPTVGAGSYKILAAFGSGGELVTTRSDQPGTGVGQWRQEGRDGFVFSVDSYVFGPEGALATSTTMKGRGTFKGAQMEGTAAMVISTADGRAAGGAQRIPFMGSRVTAAAP